jgi:hypothetical protein
LQWFGCPYFVVPWLEGDVLRIGPEDWGAALTDSQLSDLGTQVMGALAGIHRVPVQEAPYLGEPVPFAEDVQRWDRFYERAADPECLKDAPIVRQKLPERIPDGAPVGIFHGDFQIANLFCATDSPELLAVIDWELTGIGATLSDLGWIATCSDREAWSGERGAASMFLDPTTLIDLHSEACGQALPEVNWLRALAACKFAIITGFNLSLHRRGKRVTTSDGALKRPTNAGANGAVVAAGCEPGVHEDVLLFAESTGDADCDALLAVAVADADADEEVAVATRRRSGHGGKGGCHRGNLTDPFVHCDQPPVEIHDRGQIGCDAACIGGDGLILHVIGHHAGRLVPLNGHLVAVNALVLRGVVRLAGHLVAVNALVLRGVVRLARHRPSRCRQCARSARRRPPCGPFVLLDGLLVLIDGLLVLLDGLLKFLMVCEGYCRSGCAENDKAE